MNSHHTAAIEPFRYESANEHVTEPARILMLMERLAQAGGVLTLAFPDAEAHYRAPILRVDADGLTLTIGRLQPGGGNDHLRALGVVNVYGQLEGVKFHFRTSLDVGDVEGEGFRLCFPIRVDILQRREYLRLSVGERHGVKAHLEIAPERGGAPRYVQGIVADISLGGLSLHLPLAVDVREGEMVDYCTVSLPAGENLMCSLRIRHVRRDDLQGYVEVGTAFLELNPLQERIVHRYVVALERKVAWGGELVWQPGAA